MHAMPPATAAVSVGALDQPGIKPQRWRDVSLLVGALRAVPLTPALCAHPVIAWLLVTVGATTRTQTVGALLGSFQAIVRGLEVARRHQHAAGRRAQNPAQ